MVKAEPQGHAANFSHQPSDQVVVTGQSVTLPCVVTGYWGNVQWTKDGLALGAERDLPGWSRYSVSGQLSVGEHNLRIESVQIEDDAVYECQATQVGLRSRRARLTILVPPDSPVIEDGPVIKLSARALYNLTCRVSGAKPAVGIRWYKDGELQTPTLYSKGLMDDGKRETSTSILTISPDSKDTGSVYTCRVSNQATPAGKQVSTTLNVQYPPEVTLTVHPTPVLEGAKVKFCCSAKANPEVISYRWAKGQRPLAAVAGSSFEAEVDHTFFTEPVSCMVTNAIGSTNASSLVDVHFGPRLVTEPEPLIVDLGVDAIFSCGWVGNPPPTLAWTKKSSSVVLSNGDSLHLRSVTQEDSGVYICKAIVPRIGVAEKEVTLIVNGPPIITADPVERAFLGDSTSLKCFIGSTPSPDKIVWSWRENVLESGSYDRYNVETVTSDQGTVSTLTIQSLTKGDFQPVYNCTAWNRFGFTTLVIGLKESEVLQLGYIVGAAIGAAVLLIFLVTLVSICSQRSRKGKVKAEKGVRLSKSDIRVQIVHSDHITTRGEEEETKDPMATKSESSGRSQTENSELLEEEEEEEDGQEMKDPTNGYYNVRVQEDHHLPSRRGFSEYIPTARPAFDHRGPSQLSPGPGYNPLSSQHKAYDYSPRYLIGGSAQQSYGPHDRVYPQEPVYGTPSFLAPQCSRSFRTFINPAIFEKAESCDQASKLASSARFSSAFPQLSDYSRPSQQRMQTHV
ncbi:kirre like nephrin family adhesion molecule 3, like [Heptranchias perlo]|uniref:kirre like nephrin family adhesion molecule 3, like n=1 Tax=Heptranchias perlo TaxID=212740 RepID=UPI00355A7DDB